MEKEYPIELFKHGESKKVENSGQEAVARQQGFTEPYDRKAAGDYPRSLYKDGKREVHPVSGDAVNEDHVIVRSEAEEKAARARGYLLLGEEAKAKK